VAVQLSKGKLPEEELLEEKLLEEKLEAGNWWVWIAGQWGVRRVALVMVSESLENVDGVSPCSVTALSSEQTQRHSMD